MRQMLDSPMAQQMMTNPEIMQQMIMNNPHMRELMDVRILLFGFLCCEAVTGQSHVPDWAYHSYLSSVILSAFYSQQPAVFCRYISHSASRTSLVVDSHNKIFVCIV